MGYSYDYVSNHADALGSVIALTDENGTVKTRYNYSPFGKTEVIGTDSTGLSQPFRYTGREWDGDTGLYYYRARYYSPDMARFISEDPIGLAGGINMYAYVLNNPIKYTDPYGEVVQAAPLILLGGAIAIGATWIILSNPKYQETSRALARDLADCMRSEPTQGDDRDDDNYCYIRENQEISYCYTRPLRWQRGCIQRANIRRDLCLRKLPEPPPWSPLDEEAWRNPHR